MQAKTLLREIGAYCRRTGLTESGFGLGAANDAALVKRLRAGTSIPETTVGRVRTFIAAANGGPAGAQARPPGPSAPQAAASRGAHRRAPDPSSARNFRFFDNRQKYLLFVNTCSEKAVVAQRVALELANLHPRPPALRVFDAGVGDGTVLAHVLRAMHRRFTHLPFHVVGKEISLEDVRLALEKMPDRFFEHPALVFVMTNLPYREAPWLVPDSAAAATSLVWHELALSGSSAHAFEEQISGLAPFLAENWRAGVSPVSGNPVPERPAVLVIYREDHRFLLDPVIPRRGGAQGDYDLVIASQPYRARAPVAFKAERVIAPLAKSLGPGGRLLAVHSHGADPGLEILQGVWPGEDPFRHDRRTILKATREALGKYARKLTFSAYSDARSLFRYRMHALPSEVSASIGTSTLLAAWNAAIYVGQIEDARLDAVISDRRYLDVTRDVLHKHGGLWFWDESYHRIATPRLREPDA
jgi:SAM-dependent methyltransferase